MNSLPSPILFRMIFWLHLFIQDQQILTDGKYLIYFFQAMLQKSKTGGMNNLRKEPELRPETGMTSERKKGK